MGLNTSRYSYITTSYSEARMVTKNAATILWEGSLDVGTQRCGASASEVCGCGGETEPGVPGPTWWSVESSPKSYSLFTKPR